MRKKGFKHSEETKEKMKHNHWSTKNREEISKKISKSRKGMKFTLKHIENIKKSNIGGNSKSFKKGHIHSEESRLKISMTKNKGKTLIQKLVRKNKKYLQWRADVFKRDNYHCNKCGNGGKLNAHHLISLSSILKNYYIKSTQDARKCKELWDIGNGITLCEQCHKGTNNYGYKAVKLNLMNKK